MERRRVLAGLASGALVGLSGCAAIVGSRASQDYDVGMTAQAFDPYEVTVSTGEEVVWQNTSTRSHTVTAYDSGLPDGAAYFASGGFDSERAAREAFWDDRMEGTFTTDQTYSHQFTVAGTYDYFCIPHEKAGMVGRVVVED